MYKEILIILLRSIRLLKNINAVGNKAFTFYTIYFFMGR